ncbi:MAG TPA: hypothetical protein VK751_22320, partial [Undibacterium sp.]|nr:hypothetical protein [Undibacterium sp.]
MHKYLIRSLFSVAVVLPTLPAFAETEADKWNLQDLYATSADWDKDAVKLESQLKDISGCSGHLAESVKRFKACLDLNADLLKRYARLASY